MILIWMKSQRFIKAPSGMKPRENAVITYYNGLIYIQKIFYKN
jgi:hypothetical protein